MSFSSGFVVYLSATWKSETMVGAGVPFYGVANTCFGKVIVQRLNHFRWGPVVGFSTRKVQLALDFVGSQMW
tara:strand:+ start:556 stop:771 length:216 start_codon:yes stop_codon:yes gene_type:complete